MVKIGFIGLDHMGLPMAEKLVKAGHQVKGCDVSKDVEEAVKKSGIEIVKNVAHAAKGVEVVITMLPKAKRSRTVYLNDDGVLKNADPGTLLIDCSNTYAATSRDLFNAAKKAGFQLLDAPVAGGIGGAKAGTLTFMVHGDEKAYLEGEPILDEMAEQVFHYGRVGRQTREHVQEETQKRVVYKKSNWWRRSAVIMVLLFFGGNAVFIALIEEHIQIVNDRLTVSYDLGPTEYKIFCRGTGMIGLDIDGC